MWRHNVIAYIDDPIVQVWREIRQRWGGEDRRTTPHITVVEPFDAAIGHAQLVNQLRRALADMAPFEVECPGIGVFAHRVVFVKTVSVALLEMHRRLQEALSGIKEEVGGRGYNPHISLLVTEDEQVFAAARDALHPGQLGLPLRFWVKEVHLISRPIGSDAYESSILPLGFDKSSGATYNKS